MSRAVPWLTAQAQLCHENLIRVEEDLKGELIQAAAVAICQACAASVLKVGSVRRDMRWR